MEMKAENEMERKREEGGNGERGDEGKMRRK